MKTFLACVALLIVLLFVFVFNSTNTGKNVSVLDSSKISPDGVITLKNGEKVPPK
jgi:hypothetical protein